MNLPEHFFSPLIDKAIELISPSKIILFGSFARGDEKEKSDIDLAFDFEENQKNWALFRIWVEEEFKTLRELDLVNLKEADKSIVDSVNKEGIILYEK